MKSPDGAANTPGDGQPAQVADVRIVAWNGRLRFGGQTAVFCFRV